MNPMISVTDSMRDRSRELLPEEKTAEKYGGHLSVSNRHHEENFVRVRIISEDPLAQDAYMVEPSLEDLLLYHFSEETSRKDHP